MYDDKTVRVMGEGKEQVLHRERLLTADIEHQLGITRAHNRYQQGDHIVQELCSHDPQCSWCSRSAWKAEDCTEPSEAVQPWECRIFRRDFHGR